MRLGTRSVAILGSQGVIGSLLHSQLIQDDAISRIMTADPEPAGRRQKKTKARELDLFADDAVPRLAELIDECDIDTLVYMGYLSDRKEVQEHQVEETRRIVETLRRRPVPRVIFASTTVVYGAVPGDPTHLYEDTPFVEEPHSDWVRDKVACERVIRDFMLDTDDVVTVLRFAIPLGPTIQNFLTDYLRRKAVPVVAGSDPSIQVIHEEDVAGAIHHCVIEDHDGPFNIVGDGALPLTVALRIGRRRAAPVPELGSYPLHHALWEPDIIEAPAVLQDLFEYIWVADGTRANNEMSFSPNRSTKETVESFYKPPNK